MSELKKLEKEKELLVVEYKSITSSEKYREKHSEKRYELSEEIFEINLKIEELKKQNGELNKKSTGVQRNI